VTPDRSRKVATAATGSRAYTASTTDAVVPTALGMAAAYLLVALPPNLFLPAGTTRTVLVATMAAGGVACIAVAAAVARFRTRLTGVLPWIGALLAWIMTGTSVVTLVVLGQPIHTVNLVLILIASAALIHVRRVAVAVGVSVVLAWALAGWLLAPSVITTDSASAMATAAVVGAILHVVRRRSIARLEAAREEIASLLLTDELTGLGNRRALFERGGAALAAARREQQPVTLLYVDVDGLKLVNDGQGHSAGDQLIVTVARAISEAFASADVVARLGGDEFAVLMCGPRPEEVVMLQARLDAALAVLGVSVSCGASHLPGPDVPATLDRLLDSADLAMYARKQDRRTSRGRTRV